MQCGIRRGPGTLGITVAPGFEGYSEGHSTRISRRVCSGRQMPRPSQAHPIRSLPQVTQLCIEVWEALIDLDFGVRRNTDNNTPPDWRGQQRKTFHMGLWLIFKQGHSQHIRFLPASQLDCKMPCCHVSFPSEGCSRNPF